MAKSEDASEPLLVKSGEAARLLGICPRTLWSLTRKEKIPTVKVGQRGVRYAVADLRTYIESAKK